MPKALKADLEYHCPYHAVNENDDIIISTVDSLHSVKADGSNQKNLIVNVPDGWVLMMNSISPNHERLLLTMQKPSCDQDWRKSKGRSCLWGREVLWVAYHEGDV